MFKSSRNASKCGKHWHLHSSRLFRYFPPIAPNMLANEQINKHDELEFKPLKLVMLQSRELRVSLKCRYSDGMPPLKSCALHLIQTTTATATTTTVALKQNRNTVTCNVTHRPGGRK